MHVRKEAFVKNLAINGKKIFFETSSSSMELYFGDKGILKPSFYIVELLRPLH